MVTAYLAMKGNKSDFLQPNCSNVASFGSQYETHFRALSPCGHIDTFNALYSLLGFSLNFKITEGNASWFLCKFNDFFFHKPSKE